MSKTAYVLKSAGLVCLMIVAFPVMLLLSLAKLYK